VTATPALWTPARPVLVVQVEPHPEATDASDVRVTVLWSPSPRVADVVAVLRIGPDLVPLARGVADALLPALFPDALVKWTGLPVTPAELPRVLRPALALLVQLARARRA